MTDEPDRIQEAEHGAFPVSIMRANTRDIQDMGTVAKTATQGRGGRSSLLEYHGVLFQMELHADPQKLPIGTRSVLQHLADKPRIRKFAPLIAFSLLMVGTFLSQLIYMPSIATYHPDNEYPPNIQEKLDWPNCKEVLFMNVWLFNCTNNLLLSGVSYLMLNFGNKDIAWRSIQSFDAGVFAFAAARRWHAFTVAETTCFFKAFPNEVWLSRISRIIFGIQVALIMILLDSIKMQRWIKSALYFTGVVLFSFWSWDALQEEKAKTLFPKDERMSELGISAIQVSFQHQVFTSYVLSALYFLKAFWAVTVVR